MRLGQISALGLLVTLLPTGSVQADLSAFVGTVGFDEAANLKSAPGFGLRWGKSGATLGGETSLMISRPTRDLSNAQYGEQTTTAIFYEGRFLVNFPTGNLKPFVGVGLGAVTLTSTDPPTRNGEVDEEVEEVLTSISELQHNSAVSYGGGIRYRLQDRIDVRIDVRQYQVFSVTGAVIEKATSTITNETADNTVQYNELSVGVVINF
tara:strand:- start:2154 stop:2777 length:624 start_codon:yes stop_codon:yes gene_type:complete